MFLPKRLVESRRRAGALVTTAVTLPVLLGFAAVTVDVGYIYNARTDLQSAADSASLAAAAALSDVAAITDPRDGLERARDEAKRFVSMNTILGRRLVVEDKDIEFGRAIPNEHTGGYDFQPSAVMPDAVRVRVGFSKGSPNGQLPLFFAGIFGRPTTDVSASSTAAVAPRDIAVVADLSASHSDDSELQHYALTEINMHEAWDALPGGADEPGGGLWNLSTIPAGWRQADGTIPQAAGPGWGYFQKLGFGTITVDDGYSPTSDPGLVRLQYSSNWSDSALRTYLTSRSYSTTEINNLFNGSSDSSGAYEYRTAIALGFAEWNSGISGGRWSVLHQSRVGNGNSTVTSGEVTWTRTIFGNTVNESRDIWRDYINDYMRSTSTAMYDANSNFRYRFGIKTFINYLMEVRPSNGDTPELASIPEQPMQAVKDATNLLSTLLTAADANDLMSLEIYGTTAHHEIDLTDDFMSISERLSEMQAGHYDSNTNMGAGMQKAIDELTGPRARLSSKKVMLLLTDGKANIDSRGRSSTSGGAAYAIEMAHEAAAEGIVIFAVAVGVDADQHTMQQIADIGKGRFFRATGTIEQYSAELQDAFMTIGGLKAVQLIQ